MKIKITPEELNSFDGYCEIKEVGLGIASRLDDRDYLITVIHEGLEALIARNIWELPVTHNQVIEIAEGLGKILFGIGIRISKESYEVEI